MKNNDLFTLLRGLNAVADCKGARFAYCVAKNVEKLTAECKLLEKQIEPSPEFKEYDEKRSEIAKSVCDKNEDGSPKVTPDNLLLFNGSTQTPSNIAVMITTLQGEYKEALAVREKQIVDFNSLLEDESDFVPVKVKEENIPEEISGAQLLAIMSIIE